MPIDCSVKLLSHVIILELFTCQSSTFYSNSVNTFEGDVLVIDGFIGRGFVPSTYTFFCHIRNGSLQNSNMSSMPIQTSIDGSPFITGFHFNANYIY